MEIEPTVGMYKWLGWKREGENKYGNYCVNGRHVQREESTSREIQPVVQQFQGQMIYLYENCRRFGIFSLLEWHFRTYRFIEMIFVDDVRNFMQKDSHLIGRIFRLPTHVDDVDAAECGRRKVHDRHAYVLGRFEE